MKRSLPPLQLSKAPLALVLAQVRMSRVEAMGKYLPEIQEHFRIEGFPEMREGKIHNQIVVEGKTVAERQIPQWQFVNKSSKTLIQLDLDAVTVQTTEYSSFEGLEGIFKLAVDTVHSVVKPAQAHRYGLRYVNVIPVGFDSSFVEWILPNLLGHPNLPNSQRFGSYSETVLTTESASRLVARCITLPSGNPIPMDLMPCDLKLPFDAPLAEPFAILDNDHGLERSENFDPESASVAVADLHDLLDLTFRTAVTPNALEIWK